MSRRLCRLTCAALALALVAPATLAQVTSDEDEQFQAYHQDIGRISGGANTPQVAPQSTIIEKQQSHQQEAPAEEQAIPPAPVALPTRPRQQAGPRKANRITLVARREPLASTSALLLPPPPPQSAPVVASTPVFAAPAAAAAASAAASPALASFRASAGGPLAFEQPPSAATPVAERHSALMAEVAAERALQNQQPLHHQQHQHQQRKQQASLGSPLEALSSPPVAVAQLAPVASHHQQIDQHQHQHHHHHHHHQQQQQRQHHFQQPLAAASQLPLVAVQQQQQLAGQPSMAAANIENAAYISAPQAEEPLVAPSFEQVLGSGCPRKGIFSWENKDHCDRYYMCTNGTFTEEACPNGLAYSQMGAVYQHCAYNWNVACQQKKSAEPIASPGCPWQFGIFPILQNGHCSIDYYVCEWGVPEPKRCSPEGLFYDDRIKGCQWADQLGCKSEALLSFKCPAEDEDNPYWPYPRYYHNTQDVIVCVNEQPRLVHCNPDQLVDPASLACIDVKKKKKF